MYLNESIKIIAILVNWNSAELLKECIVALTRQSVPFKSLIVIDNASRDNSIEGIKELSEDITLIELEENRGFAGANNLGIFEAGKCDWIALVNPDAFPEPNWLAQLLDAAIRHPEYAFFGSRMLSANDPTRLDGTGDIYHTSGLAWRRGYGQLAKGRDLEMQEIFSPCAAAALYRRDAFLEVGGFDESYFCYFEDVDLGFRLRLAGYRCLYVPEAIVPHIGSAITGKHSDFTVYHGHRNLVWTYFKNMPWPLVWLYLPQHILLNLISLLWFTLRGQGRVIFKAKWDALKGLPRILRERRQVQARRRAGALDLRRMMAKGWLMPYFWRDRVD